MTEENGRPRHGDLPPLAFALLAATLPAGLLAIHRELGHQGDMRVFLDWYRAASGSGTIYSSASGINYPIVGVMCVFLPAWIVEAVTGSTITFEVYRTALKVLLSASEAGLILLLAPLAGSLGMRRPRLFAVATWILPATWAGGSWFGQIDVLGSLWLVAAALGASRAALAWTSRTGGAGWTALAACCLAGAVLTKQLTLFTVPAVLLLSILCPALQARAKAWKRAAVGASILAAAPVLVMAPDAFLHLPDVFSSHLAYVLVGGGSSHGDVLSGNGANVWALVAGDAGASSMKTLYLGIPARHWGMAMFGLTQAALAAWIAIEARPVLARPDAEGVRGLAGSLILAAGITNLAMATLLTGVHERYLYHGVPLLLLGLGSRAERGLRGARPVLAACWLVCGWSGLFVLSSIHWESFSGMLAPFRSHTVTGILELGLLIAIVVHLACTRRGRGISRGRGA